MNACITPLVNRYTELVHRFAGKTGGREKRKLPPCLLPRRQRIKVELNGQSLHNFVSKMQEMLVFQHLNSKRFGKNATNPLNCYCY